MPTVIRNSGGGGGGYKLEIVIPDGATAVQCYRLDEDDVTYITELFNGSVLQEGWMLKTIATPSTISSNSYIVPKLVDTFTVTAGDGTLSEFTWSEISEIAKNGTASYLFDIGDTKDFVDKLGNKETMIVIGFDHDTAVSGGTAGISFHGLYHNHSTYMNSTATNTGGWSSSYLRNTYMPYLLSSVIPDEIADNIVQVTKSSGEYGNIIQTTSDYVWLTSLNELGGATYTTAAADNSTAYEYYRDGGSLVKTRPDGTNDGTPLWWTRTVRNDGTTSFYCIWGTSGSIGSSAANTSSYEVVYGFCL